MSVRRKGSGERGIRTLDTGFPVYSLSRRAPSTYSAISPLNRVVNVAPWKTGRRGASIILSYGMAEGVGFEPTELSFNGFQDRRLKPLGHPSGI